MIVISPTAAWIKAALADCQRSLIVASPYVGSYLRKVVADLRPGIAIKLLTRTLLTDFASNASDFYAVREIAQRAGGIFSLSSLHAKIYVVDCRRALITSANATLSGMYRNRECGYEITRSTEVDELVELISSGFKATPAPQLWSAEDLNSLIKPIEALRAAKPQMAKVSEFAPDGPPSVILPSKAFRNFLTSLPGWTQLTLQGVSKIDKQVFTMQDVWVACAPLAATRFPTNRHVREKLRQQMQRLRDLGLVLFLGNGRYERLAAAAT